MDTQNTLKWLVYSKYSDTKYIHTLSYLGMWIFKNYVSFTLLKDIHSIHLCIQVYVCRYAFFATNGYKKKVISAHM